MKGHHALTVLAALLAAAPILAQTTQETPPPAASTNLADLPQTAPTPAAPDPGEEVICRRDRATGSLTRVNRICKTRNEWNGIHAGTRDAMNDMARNASGGAACRQDQMGGC
jgi:hypothetical protein